MFLDMKIAAQLEVIGDRIQKRFESRMFKEIPQEMAYTVLHELQESLHTGESMLYSTELAIFL